MKTCIHPRGEKVSRDVDRENKAIMEMRFIINLQAYASVHESVCQLDPSARSSSVK